MRQSNAERLTLFGDGCGYRAAMLDAAVRERPAVAAAAKRGRLDPTLRFARHVLGAGDATRLLDATPQLASIPLAVLAARHAYLRRVGAPCGAQLATPGLHPPLLRDLCATPANHENFAESCGGDAASVAELVAAFRRGGRRAAADGDAPLVRDLLDHGWAPARDRDRRGASAAHVAAGRGAVDVLAALVASDASLARDRDGSGATPLHWAACGVRGNAAGTGFEKRAAELLLASGADARAITHDGNAVVHWAAWQGGGSAVRAMVAAGADPHVANDRGCTSAHWAAAGGDTATLAYLRDVCNVDLQTPNAAGHTPLEHACAYKRTDIVDWLVSEDVVDPRAVEYALRVAALDADDANLRAITGMLVPNIYFCICVIRARLLAPTATLDASNWPY